MQKQVRKFNLSITILMHLLPVVLLSLENCETGEESVFHLSLQVSCPDQC
jgi:hypothetical protein